MFFFCQASDTMMKSGQQQTISTRHQCITCMKVYEDKSIEELRLEDYNANRKGPGQGQPAAGTTAMGAFGAPANQVGLSDAMERRYRSAVPERVPFLAGTERNEFHLKICGT